MVFYSWVLLGSFLSGVFPFAGFTLSFLSTGSACVFHFYRFHQHLSFFCRVDSLTCPEIMIFTIFFVCNSFMQTFSNAGFSSNYLSVVWFGGESNL